MIDEGGGRAFLVVPMLSRSQEKLLRYLGGFPDALAQAWDVPREVSLPGLSDAMGVVRSGLNQPLNALLDRKLILVRVAHVIGGGARRRQVYHITETGRRWLHDHPESVSEVNPISLPEEADEIAIVGRLQEIDELTKLLSEHGHVLLGGLSGVGKTTLLRAWKAQQSGPVRWATVDELSDAQAIAGQWMAGSGPLPRDPDAMIESVHAAGSGVLIIDDVHRLSERHQDGVVHLLGGLRNRGFGVVLAGRLPVPTAFDWPLLRLGTLPTRDAIHLLGDHLEEELRRHVAKALDGHPMALNLYREGDPLPEAGADIQAFVEQTMLMDLSEDAMESLDDMVLFPRPLPSAHILGTDSLGELDERALLRWSAGSSDVEVQHLIRNVRRTMLDKGRLGLLHRRAADHWSERTDNPAFAVLHLYHQLALEDDDYEERLEQRFEELMVDQGGAMAVIFDRATQQTDKEGLHYWAGRIALHRQEPSHVRTHLEAIGDIGRRHELAHGLAVLEGDVEEAERILNEQLDRGSMEEGARWLLKAAVALLEDRLFDQTESPSMSDVQHLLHRIQLPDGPEVRASITVSMSLVQHTMALLEQDQARAEALVDGLESLSHADDPIVLHARLKSMVAFGATSAVIRKAYERTLVAQPTPFHRAVVGLTFVEHLVRQKAHEARSVFDGLPLPTAWNEMGTPHHRYAARWWYLKGHLDPSSSASALREASRCFRQAGCTNAAKAATGRLHRVL